MKSAAPRAKPPSCWPSTFLVLMLWSWLAFPAIFSVTLAWFMFQSLITNHHEVVNLP